MLFHSSRQISNIYGTKILMRGVLWDGSLVRIMVREYYLRSKRSISFKQQINIK